MNTLLHPVIVTVTGIPKAQPRPKAARRGAFVSIYNPKTADEWKNSIAGAFKEYHGLSYNQPLAVEIDLFIPRPKAHFGSKGIRPTAPERHTGKPDLDNAAKAILDAMTDFQFWKDDSVVCDLRISKAWTDGKPGAKITIQPAA